MRVAIVAGELSGDLLGAGLLKALRARVPDLQIEGIGGPGMAEQGLQSLYPMDALSVMGLVEVLGALPQLLRLRRRLAQRWSEQPPDVFIGIDAPEFNLGLERRLRARGVRTVHYVSPSVWAWRQGRMRGIRQSVDLMLTLFPFEQQFYAAGGVASAFVGHPAADRFAEQRPRSAYRADLGLAGEREVVALLPGSRMSEVSRLTRPFLDAAREIAAARPGLQFLAPMANSRIRDFFGQAVLEAQLSERVTLLDGRSAQAMGAADCVLLASGTATLEAMLLRRPMVVAYKVAPVTYFILKRMGLVKIDRFALPNLLSGEDLVPEFIQDEAEPRQLARAVLQYLEDPRRTRRIEQRFADLHESLLRNADSCAAEAVLECLKPST